MSENCAIYRGFTPMGELRVPESGGLSGLQPVVYGLAAPECERLGDLVHHDAVILCRSDGCLRSAPRPVQGLLGLELLLSPGREPAPMSLHLPLDLGRAFLGWHGRR